MKRRGDLSKTGSRRVGLDDDRGQIGGQLTHITILLPKVCRRSLNTHAEA